MSATKKKKVGGGSTYGMGSVTLAACVFTAADSCAREGTG